MPRAHGGARAAKAKKARFLLCILSSVKRHRPGATFAPFIKHLGLDKCAADASTANGHEPLPLRIENLPDLSRFPIV